jgi:aspartate kinase
LTIDNTHRLAEVSEELERFSTVSSENGQAIVAIVGDNIRYTPGIAARALLALRNVNVRMISQGASLLNLSLVVAESELETAMRALHDEFFRELDPEVFV